MYSCCCSSLTIIINFVLFSFAYSSPLTTSNQHINRMRIPIIQTLNSDAVLISSRHQNQNSTIELHISSTHSQSIMPSQGTRQRLHALEEDPQPEIQSPSSVTEISPSLPQNTTPQARQELDIVEGTPRPETQKSSATTEISPTQPQSTTPQTSQELDINEETPQPGTQKSSAGTEISPTQPQGTTPQARQELDIVEETPQPETQKSSSVTEISPTQPQNTTPQTRQELDIVEETPQPETQYSSSTVPSSALLQNPSPVLRTRRQNNNTDILQLPNGPPLRFQRPRASMRRPVGQQNHGDMLQQRHGDIVQQRLDDKVQQSDLPVNPDKRPHGAPQKFCNMFGCDCAPPPGAKCCVGYRFDKRANKCRQVVG